MRLQIALLTLALALIAPSPVVAGTPKETGGICEYPLEYLWGSCIRPSEVGNPDKPKPQPEPTPKPDPKPQPSRKSSPKPVPCPSNPYGTCTQG